MKTRHNQYSFAHSTRSEAGTSGVGGGGAGGASAPPKFLIC